MVWSLANILFATQPPHCLLFPIQVYSARNEKYCDTESTNKCRQSSIPGWPTGVTIGWLPLTAKLLLSATAEIIMMIMGYRKSKHVFVQVLWLVKSFCNANPFQSDQKCSQRGLFRICYWGTLSSVEDEFFQIYLRKEYFNVIWKETQYNI